MNVPSPKLYLEGLYDACPLLMEHSGPLNGTQFIIDIAGSSEASTSTSPHDRNLNGVGTSRREDRVSSVRIPASLPSVSVASNGTNSRNSSVLRRGDTRRHRSPLNSGLWISIELVLIVSQIVASIIVLSLSRQEHPHTPLFAWIIGYASGCVATIPFLGWRYYHHNHSREQNSSQPRQTSPRVNVSSRTLLSVSRTNGGEDDQVIVSSSRSSQVPVMMNPRLCIVFLTFSCIGYAMPFILCATICCCLPCIISILGVREDLTQTRGATSESINALPTYKFKVKKRKNIDESNSNVFEGGIVAAGTEKERVISGEDAVCCICLAKYENNDELRELPCSHLLHKECVDKWLKINALCPLCKGEVGGNLVGSVSGEGTNQQRGESRVGVSPINSIV
ncbi:E3 ubiquitin-protein ligase At1g12760-like isoform X4 [Prosopis cineraria]|uniref:E3 ubiquitin-protein ligase At1g12760-like isoform X4 n=1 Tax=Prosopis cineraria TaxID=364024 RepID=UPI00240F7BB1|nr:E3 ubiquitin-protein ligase At1g12760-like isoform X4 [Prosopis cineraria]